MRQWFDIGCVERVRRIVAFLRNMVFAFLVLLLLAQSYLSYHDAVRVQQEHRPPQRLFKEGR